MLILNKLTFNVYEWQDGENSEKRLSENPTLERYEGETEEAYDGLTYAKGHAPQKSKEDKEHDVRLVRDRYLSNSDKYTLPDFPISDEEREKWLEYRQYLRDYTKSEDWYEQDPLTFEEWRVRQ